MTDNNAKLVTRLLIYAGQLRQKAGYPADQIGRRLVEVAEQFEEKAYQLLQEPSAPHLSYRVYFRTKHGIRGRDDFDVEDDDTALTIAALLADACSDQCTSFDLWQGTRHIRGIQMVPPQSRSLSELREKHQALVIEREEAIRDSEFAIASSRRLLKRLSELGYRSGFLPRR